MSVIDDINSNLEIINDIYYKYVEEIRSNTYIKESYSGANSLNFIRKGFCIYNSKGCYVDSVLWEPGKVAVYESMGDVISFDFSGCLMAKIKSGDLPLYAHIHCDTSVSKDSRYDFVKFLETNNIQDDQLVLFRPLCDDQYLHFPQSYDCRYVWGVITKENKCYTIISNGKVEGDKIHLYLDSIYEHIHSNTDEELRAVMKKFSLKHDKTLFDENRKELDKVLNKNGIKRIHPVINQLCRI